MRTAFWRLAPAVLFVFVLASVFGCGGGGNDKSAETLLDKAFKHSIQSADLKLDAQIQLPGGSNKPYRLEATGPFRNNKGKLPSANIDLTIGRDAQNVTAGFLSTGDRTFVKFQDVYYEQPPSRVAQANRSIASRSTSRGSLKALGLDPRRWLEDAKNEGDAQVAGADTTHVSGKLDVSRIVEDFNSLAERSGSAIGSATGQVPRPLTKSQIDKISQVVKDPTFDVYVAKSDETIRRVAGHIDFKVPKGSGSLSFGIQFSNVNGNQRIVAPAKARPLSDLTRSLGTSVLGGSGGSSPGTSAPTPSGPAPGSDAFKRYSQCLDRANPRDTDAIQRCSELLQ